MQQELDFGVYATAAGNHARRKNAAPVLDRDGLFDIDGVTIICGRRQCAVEPAGELFLDVRFKETVVRVTAIAPGKWDPVAVLTACTRAHGNRAYAVDYEKVAATNPGGLDELRIAAIVGADGVRPYLNKTSRHFVDGRSVWGPEKRPVEVEQCFGHFRRVPAGNPTWAFRMVLFSSFEHGSAYNVRRSLRALEDAGLVRIELGPNNGMTRAKIEWLPRAYLAPERLAPDDEEALGELA